MHKEKGTLAIFDDTDQFLVAAEKARKMNIEYMEAYTPFLFTG
jgi:hypothetical protein